MLSTFEGVYRNGKVEFSEVPVNFKDETKVLVVFLDKNVIQLSERGIDKSQAVELRDRLTTFIDDWESPEMDIYNDYDNYKSRI